MRIKHLPKHRPPNVGQVMFREMFILETVLLSERVSFFQLKARIAHSRHLRGVTNYNNALSLICQLAENVHYLLLIYIIFLTDRCCKTKIPPTLSAGLPIAEAIAFIC